MWLPKAPPAPRAAHAGAPPKNPRPAPGAPSRGARGHVRVARALGSLPLLAQALARGELSYSKIRALTRVASPETEERLLAVARAGTAEHVERIVRGWRRVDRIAEARESTRRHRSRALHVYRDEDGMVVIRGRLAPEVGAALLQALAAARETLYQRARARQGGDVPAGTPGGDVPAETPTMAQQQADALALVAETVLHHGIDPGAPGERYQVVVHVTEVGARTRTGATTGSTAPGPGLLLPRLRTSVRSGPSPSPLGPRRPDHLSNLALLCRRHHRAVHEDGYQVERQADGELRL